MVRTADQSSRLVPFGVADTADPSNLKDVSLISWKNFEVRFKRKYHSLVEITKNLITTLGVQGTAIQGLQTRSWFKIEALVGLATSRHLNPRVILGR